MVKNLPTMQETPDSIPGLRGSPGEGNSNPLQYSCLENSRDRGAWRPAVHEVTKSWTWLSDSHIMCVLIVQCGLMNCFTQWIQFFRVSWILRNRTGGWKGKCKSSCIQFSSIQSLSRVWFFVTPWISALQASLSITNSRSLLKLMPIESVVPSSHLILCHPLLLLPLVVLHIVKFSSVRVGLASIFTSNMWECLLSLSLATKFAQTF